MIAWGLSLERPTMIMYDVDNIRDLFGSKIQVSTVGRCSLTPGEPRIDRRLTTGRPQVDPRLTQGSFQVHPRFAPGSPRPNRA